MLKNFSIYNLLWLLIQLLIEVNCQQTVPFKPPKRNSHTATFINEKLYILGGRLFGGVKTNNDEFTGKQFFYLDVSVSFNTQKLLWQDLTNINAVPSHYEATSVNGGASNNTLFLYGGFGIKEPDLVHAFDTKTNSWSVPKTMGGTLISLTGIVDYNGKMYLFSGYNGQN